MFKRQIKSRQRVSTYGEVYTRDREVNAMLNMIGKDVLNCIDSTFLEPACGNGNFLVEILKRKLELVKDKYNKSTYEFELYSVIAVTSIYGVDILHDNVVECRMRLLELFIDLYNEWYGTRPATNCLEAISFILTKNIVCGNTLTAMSEEQEKLILSQWVLKENGIIEQKEFLYSSLLNENGCCTTYVRSHRYIWMMKNAQFEMNNLEACL